MAFNFFRAPLLKDTPTSADHDVLKSKINGDTGASAETWKEIRHFIGRLGALKKAANFVASEASCHSDKLQSFKVCCVESMPTQHTVDIRLRHSLHDLLHRVSPRLSSRHLLESTVEKMARAKTLTEKLAHEIKETVVHAEAAMAHHFYVNNLRFVDDEAYIGCSKPSCYACRLYLIEHPGRFSPRQSSGNAYTKWSPPLHQDEDLRGDGTTMRILSLMISKIDTDILSDAENRTFAARPQFDSTTGMTADRAISVQD